MATHWRHYPRVIPDPELPLRLALTPAPVFGDFRICDISEGGMELAVAGALEAGLMNSHFELDLWLPDPVGEQLTLEGAVRHMEDDRVGIAFVELTEEQRRSLQAYVSAAQKHGRLLNRLKEKFKRLVD